MEEKVGEKKEGKEGMREKILDVPLDNFPQTICPHETPPLPILIHIFLPHSLYPCQLRITAHDLLV